MAKAMHAFFIFCVISCRQAAKNPSRQVQGKDTVAVRLWKVAATAPSQTLGYTGVLASKGEVLLAFKSPGIIHKLLASEGGFVRRGQLLAALETTEFEAEYARARANYELLKADEARYAQLLADSFSSQQLFEAKRTQKQVAAANLQVARFNLANAFIRAPANGFITRRFKQQGEIASPGHPVVAFHSTHLANWIVRIGVTDAHWQKIQLNQSAVVRFDALGGRGHGAFVAAKAVAADPATGLFTIEISLRQDPANLALGMFASVDIHSANNLNQVAIPATALATASGNTAAVFLYKNGRVERRQINIGHLNDDMILVTSGLLIDDLIVAEGAAYTDETVMLKPIQP